MKIFLLIILTLLISQRYYSQIENFDNLKVKKIGKFIKQINKTKNICDCKVIDFKPLEYTGIYLRTKDSLDLLISFKKSLGKFTKEKNFTCNSLKVKQSYIGNIRIYDTRNRRLIFQYPK